MFIHCLLKAKAAASAEDNPNWRRVMNGQFADEYWESAVTVMTWRQFGLSYALAAALAFNKQWMNMIHYHIFIIN